MILEFLTFRRLGAEQRAPRENQILALKEKFFVDKEVFLLGSYRGDDLGGVFTEYREQSYRLIGQRLGGAEKRGPEYEQNAVGIHSVPSFMNASQVGSHAV